MDNDMTQEQKTEQLNTYLDWYGYTVSCDLDNHWQLVEPIYSDIDISWLDLDSIDYE